MSLQYAKPALDAMTDQSLAAVRAKRDKSPDELVRLAGQVAGILAEQFPDGLVTAGRAVMSAVQMAATVGALVGALAGEAEPDEAVLDLVMDVLALAAEQVVREATEGGGSLCPGSAAARPRQPASRPWPTLTRP